MKRSLLFIISLLFSFVFFYFIGEKYFFDKLFYKKDIFHGYCKFPPMNNSTWKKFSNKFNLIFVCDDRTDDLIDLVNNSLNKTNEKTELYNKKLFKIVLIGDSMFFGTGVKSNQTISFYLNKKLPNVKIYNLSLHGDDILDNYIKYEMAKKYIDPDFFILSLVDNDLILSENNRYPQKADIFNEMTQNCTTETLLNPEEALPNSWGEQLRYFYAKSFNKKYKNECLLDNISKNITKNKLMTITYGCTESCSFEESKMEADVCLSRDLYQSYSSYFSDSEKSLNLCRANWFKSISKNEWHPSSKTNEIIAKKIALEIQNSDDWKNFFNLN